MSDPEGPVGLYMAAYSDASAAQTDWEALEQLQTAGAVKVDGMVLLARDADGKIDVKDTAHTTARGTGWGAVGGAVVGLLFPPALLGATVVGAGLGAGIGGLKSHSDKKEIKEDVEDVMPNNSSGILALLEPQWAGQVKQVLAHADKVTEREV
ncbi:MAG: DUF1269 domain-containing protein, partial [Thermoleophilia bacterium]|nr:DUF1269 domain-containing protein [Thermoleophilia bacterium]